MARRPTAWVRFKTHPNRWGEGKVHLARKDGDRYWAVCETPINHGEEVVARTHVTCYRCLKHDPECNEGLVDPSQDPPAPIIERQVMMPASVYEDLVQDLSQEDLVMLFARGVRYYRMTEDPEPS